MANLIYNTYRFLFSRKFFYKLNRFLFYLSLKGLGILNYESYKVSGEEYAMKKCIKSKNNMIIFDIGANIGSYSKKILEINSDAIIYAFEPHPQNYQKLITNINCKQFKAYNYAVGSKTGETLLYDYKDVNGSTHASIYKDVIEKIHNKASDNCKVETVRLDEFCLKNQVAKIDFLKIDTEGNELDVLLGIRDYIKLGKIAYIHFEFNEMNVVSKTFFNDFWE